MKSVIEEIQGTVLSFRTSSDDKGKKFDILDVLGIDEDQLTGHYTEQAALLGYFSAQLAAAEYALNIAKFKAEQEYAAADAYYRADFDKRDKKYTESVIKSAITLDEVYSQAMEVVHQAEYDVALIKGIVNALKSKGDMLISIGAHMRQEYDATSMSMRRMDKAVDDVKGKMKMRRGGSV